jgi:phosphatidylglycerol:prolipoprotein diacylglycerol transferase
MSKQNMYPDLIEIGGLRIAWFGVLMALAFLTGGLVLASELRRKGENPERASSLVGWAILGGIAGAKIYYLALNWPGTMADPKAAVLSRAGLVWYGGFVGAIALVLWRLRRNRLPVLLYGDAIAPALALAYGVGRVGCFMAGDDYGLPTNLPWGVAFPRGLPPSTAYNLRAQFGVAVDPSVPDSAVLAVHPTQLYEVAMTLAIFAVLWKRRQRWQQPGVLFFVYLTLAGIERFAVEAIRAKDDRFLGPLTVAQAISLGLIAAGLVGLARVRAGRPSSGCSASPARAPARAARRSGCRVFRRRNSVTSFHSRP